MALTQDPEWVTSSHWEILWRDGTSIGAPLQRTTFPSDQLGPCIKAYKKMRQNNWISVYGIDYVTQLREKQDV